MVDRAMNDETTDFMARARARGEAKNQEARAALQPLAPGERPLAITIGSIVAMLMAAANVVAFLASDGDKGGSAVVYIVLLCAVLVAASVGMWFRQYWAVLGFQTVLALQILFLGLSLMKVESVWVLLLFCAIIAALGAMFWFLIRAMARIQMPEGPGQRSLRERLAEIEEEQAAAPGATARPEERHNG